MKLTKTFNKIISFVENLKNKNRQSKAEVLATDSRRDDKKQDYFVLARSWADDMYTSTVTSMNRYKMAFYWSTGLAVLLLIIATTLIMTQHTELVVVHHYNDGTVWVESSRHKYAPVNKKQTEGELVRYVINRESYSSFSYREKYSLVTLLSSSKVANQYARGQSVDNKLSPINLLGTHGIRKVHVENVIFLDNKDSKENKNDNKIHVNLAQVNFKITDQDNESGSKKSVPLTALIAWEYRGTPEKPADMWRNWDGFLVTKYEISEINVK